MGKSELEEEFAFHLKAASVKQATREYVFATPRKWRFDFAWPAEMVAVEIEGGIYSQGRHVRPQGFIKDCEKLNAASFPDKHGRSWCVFRFCAEHVHRGDALVLVEKALKRRKGYAKEKR
jgi:hypothetical protein